MLHALLKEASLVSISDADLTIDFDPRFNWHREQVQEAKNRTGIEAELSEIVGKPMSLRIKANDSSQDGNSEESVPTSKVDMLRDAKEDESVKLVLDVFNGRIVEVKQ
jgi:hypothetical protein